MFLLQKIRQLFIFNLILSMANLIRNFIQHTSLSLMERLTSDHQPLWGKMGPQHMLEHVSAVFYISRKDLGIPVALPEEKYIKLKKFLWNDRPMGKHFYIEGVHPPQPLELRNKNIEEAKALFAKSIQGFYQHYQNNPNDSKIHPVFGPLNFEEWERFHYKHIYHHFSQFGLIEETEIIPVP
ncbi:MAG: DUF1569 domain-containing protein [Bacteroidia bacterium]